MAAWGHTVNKVRTGKRKAPFGAEGGVLLGGIGAVAGAVAGGKTTESTVIIEFKNGNKALAKVNSPMMEVIRAHLFDDQLAQERGEPNPLIHHERSQTPPKKIALIIGVLIT